MCSWYHVQLTLILMLLMSQSFGWSFQDTCCLTLHTPTMQKPGVFAAFQTKTSQLTLELNKKHEKHAFATLSQKRYQKTRTKDIGKRKHRNVLLLTKTSQNTGFSCCRPKNLPNINDTPRAAADARATLFLFLFLFFLLLLLW